jgi:hypothetical protein
MHGDIRNPSPSERNKTPNLASQIRFALSKITSKTGFKSPGDELITLSTSEMAESCSDAAFSSPVSRATDVSWPAAEERRRRTAFSALRRFSVTGLLRGPLAGLPPDLDRRFISVPTVAEIASYRLRPMVWKGLGSALCDCLVGQAQCRTWVLCHE